MNEKTLKKLEYDKIIGFLKNECSSPLGEEKADKLLPHRDMVIVEGWQKETTEAVVFIVAQRVTTVMGADRIIVLDEGEVVGIGKHKELMQTCPVYKEIILSQLSEEEVA